MISKDKVIEENQFLSDRLSNQIRLVTFGILGIIWGFLVSDSEIAKLIVKEFGQVLLSLIFVSILILLTDYLQYICGYVNTNNLIKFLEKHNLKEGQYDTGSISYKLRFLFFYIKHALLILDVVFFLGVLIIFFLRT